MPEPTFEEFLSTYNPQVRELAYQAQALIRSVLPEALELVDPPSRLVAYGSSPRYADLVCALALYPNHVNLMFSRGATLPDPDGLLAGTGKRARHIRLETPSDLARPGVRALLVKAAGSR